MKFNKFYYSIVKQIPKQNKPLIVDFYANWCGPCKMLTPILEKSIKASNGKVDLLKINIDENQELAEEYNVTSIPTVVLIKDGKETSRFVGMKNQQGVELFIMKSLQ